MPQLAEVALVTMPRRMRVVIWFLVFAVFLQLVLSVIAVGLLLDAANARIDENRGNIVANRLAIAQQSEFMTCMLLTLPEERLIPETVVQCVTDPPMRFEVDDDGNLVVTVTAP